MTLGAIISIIGVVLSTGFNVVGIVLSAMSSVNEALSFYSGMLNEFLPLVPAPFTTICVFSAGLMIFTKARRG